MFPISDCVLFAQVISLAMQCYKPIFGNARALTELQHQITEVCNSMLVLNRMANLGMLMTVKITNVQNGELWPIFDLSDKTARLPIPL